MSSNNTCRQPLEDGPGILDVDGKKKLTFDMFRMSDAGTGYAGHVDNFSEVPTCLDMDTLRMDICGFTTNIPMGENMQVDTKLSTIPTCLAIMRRSLLEDLTSRGVHCNDQQLTEFLTSHGVTLDEEAILTAFKDASEPVERVTRGYCPLGKHTGHINDIFDLQAKLSQVYHVASELCEQYYPGNREESIDSVCSGVSNMSLDSFFTDVEDVNEAGSSLPAEGPIDEHDAALRERYYPTARRAAG